MALALITGGGTGLGAALADRLAARGHDLLLVTRDPERVAPSARELAARYGVRADVLVADLGTRHGLFRLEAHLAGPEAPAVDILVHDALADAAAASDAGQVGVDLGTTATMRLTHAALPGMLRRGAGGVVAISGDEQSAAWAVSFVTALAPTLTGEVHVVAVRGDDRPEWTADAADAVLDDLDAGVVVSAPQTAPARPDPARRAVAAGVRVARRAVELFADATWQPTGPAAAAAPDAAAPAVASPAAQARPATPEELLGGAGYREPARLPDLPSRPGAGRAVVAAGDCGRHWAAGPVRTAAQRARASAAARDRSRGHRISAYMTSTVTSS
ncbi:short-chain dehydrogenase/reductase SDR [Pseudonocardia sp. Ae406_Ps2]|uniref:SDR family NAD(P)-dependent oxidoreductase n=1 Tax=unclassified Pseudonocardia TaxID=2619320 RepID=UPI00094ABEA3|nr:MULTISPECIES: SDR family NAD(P)-dependent oxidoreductase [unclassified Pseudonocardia]OLL98304.1 short-chain dehydrogenase/reductase SDR [Pseudonocardia sp. Ae331_Ps2]OLM03985.1 short-chain dehydrogenase/reductase SDR [Pseudonocardia sp. Ae406_Ps2]OLM11188.1 short-chain dehydrogenase/reductase SDR [Pseudonocardia sp. Ae505_Ps2]OLM25533.1 short-chain dehydrogenase/reductase SDR [Pseudonocardia sp. Ae706_Ps2]OLM34306.1 short-chain dehydrogenase/reductase SDR [Pseudonocardia sp. Ae717_Ps2]